MLNLQTSYRDFVASLIFLVFSLFNFSEENVSLKTFEKWKYHEIF